jgi:ribosomal protein S18 acetylase RimI-like enzyme
MSDFEPVHTTTDYYDGPRRGIADYQGQPHIYESTFNDFNDGFADIFRLSPVPQDVFALALEDWQIWRRWETAFHNGTTPNSTHPALPADKHRYDELQMLLENRLTINQSNYFTARGEFRVRDDRRGFPPLEVKWSPINDSILQQNDIAMETPAILALRQANIDDAPLFYSVIDRTMRDFVVITWGAWDEARVRRESEEKSRDPNAQVIQVGDVYVGVFVVDRCPTHIELQQIYLLPEYQRMGIGTALLNSVVSEGERLKIPVRLHVMAINPAKNFYERFGFVVTEATSEFFFMEKAP